MLQQPLERQRFGRLLHELLLRRCHNLALQRLAHGLEWDEDWRPRHRIFRLGVSRMAQMQHLLRHEPLHLQ